MAEYRLSTQAARDIEAIYEYTFRQFGERQAELYIDQLTRAAQAAADFPFVGRTYSTRWGTAYRQYNCARHAIFYRPIETGILVARFLHLMMDFGDHLD